LFPGGLSRECRVLPLATRAPAKITQCTDEL